jgi:hypothetical protein
MEYCLSVVALALAAQTWEAQRLGPNILRLFQQTSGNPVTPLVLSLYAVNGNTPVFVHSEEVLVTGYAYVPVTKSKASITRVIRKKIGGNEHGFFCCRAAGSGR